MDKKYCILLVRVSTHQQDYDAQITDIKKKAAGFGYTDYKIIQTKETGLADLSDKVGTNEMFQFILNNPEYNTVIATEMSRLGRRQSVLQLVKEWFIKHEVQLFVKDSGFWLFENGKVNANAQMSFTIYALFAEAEIQAKKARFIRSRRDLMAKGISISGKLLFGYKREELPNKKNTLIKNEEEAKVIRDLYNWYLHGKDDVQDPSIKHLTLECIKEGYPKYTHSKRNVNKLLKEKGYTGFKTTNNKRKNPLYKEGEKEPKHITSNNEIKYPPIIEQDLFDRVQLKLKSNVSKKTREGKHTTILAKLIRCSSCGRNLSANYRFKQKQPKHSYRCTSRTDAQPCGNTQSISMSLIDSAVWSLIKTDLPALTEMINEINPDVELAKLKSHRANLIVRKDEIEEEVNSIKNSFKKITVFKGFEEVLESWTNKLEKLNFERDQLDFQQKSIDSNLLLLNNRQKDIDSIIMDNLESIEASKELLKQYVNHFVDEIEILEHTVPYSIIKIQFKHFTMPDFMSLVKEKEHVPTKKVVYLAIDKKVTRQIHLSRSIHYPISVFAEASAQRIKAQIKQLVRSGCITKHQDYVTIPYTKLNI